MQLVTEATAVKQSQSVGFMQETVACKKRIGLALGRLGMALTLPLATRVTCVTSEPVFSSLEMNNLYNYLFH